MAFQPGRLRPASQHSSGAVAFKQHSQTLRATTYAMQWEIFTVSPVQLAKMGRTTKIDIVCDITSMQTAPSLGTY
jgi:hypothetical protein